MPHAEAAQSVHPHLFATALVPHTTCLHIPQEAVQEKHIAFLSRIGKQRRCVVVSDSRRGPFCSFPQLKSEPLSGGLLSASVVDQCHQCAALTETGKVVWVE